MKWLTSGWGVWVMSGDAIKFWGTGYWKISGRILYFLMAVNLLSIGRGEKVGL